MKNNRLFNKLEFNSQYITNKIRKNVLTELTCTAYTTLCSMGNEKLVTIIKEWEKLLIQAENILKNNLIDPNIKICLSENTLPQMASNKVLRIGIYPVSANPLHWGHLLIGLSAIVHHRLDKIIFIIAGHDPRKPHLAPE